MSFKPVAPSIFTCSNGICGLCAILAAATGHPELAVLFIGIALVCDGLDGQTARKLNVASEFGVQYDTVNDTTTFGVAPAVLGFFALHPVIGLWAIVPCAIYTGCAKFRLARFNARKQAPQQPKKSTYDGMPTTGGAMVCMALAMAALHLPLAPAAAATLIITGLIISGVLMVSTIQYGVLKHVVSAPRRLHLFVTLPVIVLTIVSWQLGLLALAMLYALHGPALALWGLIFKPRSV